MAAMNPILRLRQAFRSMGVADEPADEAADAIDYHTYGRRESDLFHAQMMMEFRRDMAEMRTQMLLAIFIAAGMIIAAGGVLIAVFD